MSYQCGICNNTKENKTYQAREMMFGTRETFEYFMCPSCSCLQITTPPENMAPYYPAEYYSYNQELIPAAAWWKRNFKRQRTRYFLHEKGLLGKLQTKLFGPPFLEPWAKMTNLDVDSKVVDIGCGIGCLLSRLANEGFSDLSGIDPYIEKGIDHPNRFRIYKKDIHELSEQFDFIMLHHSFEHMLNPQTSLKAIYDLTKPEGRVLIRIPVISWAWEYYGVNWCGLDAPRHFWLHSTNSMEQLCRQCNFEIEDVLYDSTGYMFWGSEQYLRDIPLMDPRSLWTGPTETLFSESELSEWEKRADELNLQKRGDQACFLLRKIGCL